MMGRDTPSFGTVLRQFRIAASLSQEALAERAGLSLRGISDLEREVRRTPHLSTVSLLANALALEPSERQRLLAAARPAPPLENGFAPGSEPGQLPTPLTTLIGREGEVAALCHLLRQDEVRLLTVTGPGGVGKTRLVLAVAQESAAAFGDGVIFVSLAPLRDAGLVGAAIAQAAGLRSLGARSVWELLASHLSARRALLVLDNLEHLLDAAPLVANLLATCPRLKVLATSRSSLHLSGEHDFQVAPLPLPTTDVHSTVDELAEVAAIQLFVRRAQAVAPGFALTPTNAPAIAEIVQRLDGLPLAIELAAARVTLLSPHAMLPRLEPRLPLLAGGSRDLPDRLRTMRDAIAWSYDLLAPDEQALFRHLSVFAGGFTLEAAEAVGADLDADVLGGLVGLIDQSLVRQLDPALSGIRYGMLETVREFALEQLDAHGEGDAVRGAHANYFLHLAEQAAAANFSEQEPTWLDLLEAERANLRAAQDWLEHAATPAPALRLAAACYRFWRVRGPVAEGRAVMERAVALPGPAPEHLRVLITLFAGELAYVQGNRAADRARLEDALALARQLGDPAVLAFALNSNARVLLEQGDEAAAEQLWEQAVALARSLDEQSLAFRYAGSMLEHLGFLARRRRDFARAAALTQEALAWAERIGFEWSAAMILASLAAVAREEGDFPRAASLYAASLRRIWAQRDRRNFASALLGFALAIAEQGRLAPAAQLCGAAGALFDTDANALPIIGRADQKRVHALLQASLGQERYAEAVAAGERLSPEEALALVEELAV